MTGPGDLIAERYRLVRHLGGGGMGVVWEARDVRLERAVAVKQLRIHPGLSDAEAELATSRAMREARNAARLHHRHAVSVFDVVEHENQPCLVMELVPSVPLTAVLRELGRLEPHEAARVGAQTASALAAAHQVDIVHRDVKPGNILIGDDGHARISDFGISRALSDTTLTMTGMMTGTPAYLAPEVARGGSSSFASDVFSLGATLYTAVEGAPPFGTDPNVIALLYRVAGGQIEPPRQSGELEPVLRRMLAADPADRPSMSEVVHLLVTVETGTAPDNSAPVGSSLAAQGSAAAAIMATRGEPDRLSAASREQVSAASSDQASAASPDEVSAAHPSAASLDEAAPPDRASAEAPDQAGAASPDPAGAASPDPAGAASPDPAGAASPDPAGAASPDHPIAARVVIPASAPPVRDGSRRPGRRRRPLAVVTLVLLLGAVVLAATFLPGSSRTTVGGAVDAQAGPASASSTNPQEQSAPVRPASSSSTPVPSSPTPRPKAEKPAATNDNKDANKGKKSKAEKDKGDSDTGSDPSANQSKGTSKNAGDRKTDQAEADQKSTGNSGSGEATAAGLAAAITDYYRLMPGDTDQAWPKMTASYQANHAGGRQSYERFWRAVRTVSVSQVQGTPPSGASAMVTYTFTDGRVVQERTAYRLVRDDGTLKIDGSEVLSSNA